MAHDIQAFRAGLLLITDDELFETMDAVSLELKRRNSMIGPAIEIGPNVEEQLKAAIEVLATHFRAPEEQRSVPSSEAASL